MKTIPTYRTMRALLVSAALLSVTHFAGAAAVTNWAAYNDHNPSAITHANATRYNMRGIAGSPPQPTSGPLKDFGTGFDVSAYFISTATGTPDFFGSIQYPAAGTPAYNLFNGIVDLGNTDSAIGIRSSANSTVTLTFSNLNPSQRYIFAGTAVRGNNYVRRWTLASIRGADAYTDAHTTGVYTKNNFPTGTMTNGQASYNSGENRADGALVRWVDIDPGPDGVFIVKCEQYIDNPLPNGQTPDLGAYGYAFAGIYLAEVGEPTPVTFTAHPPSSVVLEQNRPLTLTGLAQGAPAPTYQWYKDDVEIPGATTRTFSIAQAQPTDSGNYYLVATNFLNMATSTVAAVTVYPDTNGPVLLKVSADDSFGLIRLTWDEPVAEGSAIEFSNYLITDPMNNQATINGLYWGGSNVVLFVSELTPDTEYTFEAGSQQDVLGNPTKKVGNPTLDPDFGIVTNLHSWVYTPGLVRYQNYLNLPAGETLAQFVAMPIYPDVPDTTFYTNTPYAPQSAPNLDQFAIRLTGIFVAPEDGLHKFNPAHDDDARLRIYPGPTTNGTPTELAETGTSDLVAGLTADVTLTTGQRCYYELLVREFTGGDYAGLAVTLPSATVSAPISASYLEAAADPALAPNVGIEQQPQNQTIEENHTATFTVVATNTGGSVSYQWQVDTGSGFANILGANNASYTTPLQTLANNGNIYRVRVYVPGRIVTSDPATLTVITDTNAPYITSVRGARNMTNITVNFNEVMEAGSATEPTNYELRDAGNNVVTLGVVTLSADLKSVNIETAPQTPGAFYTLQVSFVADAAGNSINSTSVTFQVFVFSRGFVQKELYMGLSTSTVSLSDLTNAAKYPNSPDIVRYGNLLELNTFDEFEGYGARLSGVIMPPTSGNYTFYMAADDNGEFWLSTDSNPANRAALAMIAREPVWSGRRTWTGEAGGGSRLTTPSPSGGPQANISGPIALVAGQAYYFEALVKEGGGGDNLAATWQPPGGAVPVNGSSPIPGAYLGAMADPVGASVTITQQPASTLIDPGQTAAFSVGATGVTVSGVAPLAYQWQKKVVGTFEDIAGANSASYTTPTLLAGDSGTQYRALVFIPGANATSSVATVTVGTPQPTLRYERSGNVTTLSWDDGAYYLQCATTLTPTPDWKNVTSGGVTTYVADPSNEFDVLLDTAQAGGGARTGSGKGTATLSGNTLALDITYSGLSGTRSASHIHAPAPRGGGAGVAYDLSALDTGNGMTSGTIVGNVSIVDGAYGGKTAAQQIQDLRGSLWYVNIHTSAFDSGEIRGQIEPAGTRFYRLYKP